MAKGKPIDNPYLVGIVRAKQINQQVGGFMIAPWDISELPEDWLLVFDGLANQLPELQVAQNKVTDKLAELRKRYVQ